MVPHPSATLPDPEVSEAQLREEFGLQRHRVVLSFGFIDIDKGIQDLIRAVSLLRRDPRLADVRLAIAGTVRGRFGPFRIFEFRDRAYFAYLERIIRRLGMEQEVVLAGYVPSGATQPWFRLASVAALPYRRCEAKRRHQHHLGGWDAAGDRSGGRARVAECRPRLEPADSARFAAGLTRILEGDEPSRESAVSDGEDFAAVALRTSAIYTELRWPSEQPGGQFRSRAR